ncbi:MAG TPA: hypothetical protein PLW68_14780 [Casimicrobiaceae bacterium]|nr:hypothetical protein [Casimicrobiaceae bacterium]
MPILALTTLAAATASALSDSARSDACMRSFGTLAVAAADSVTVGERGAKLGVMPIDGCGGAMGWAAANDAADVPKMMKAEDSARLNCEEWWFMGRSCKE